MLHCARPHTACLVISLALLLLSASAALAQDKQDIQRRATQINATRIQDTARAQAELWGLSLQEWNRYQRLLKGIAGYRSDKLDPIMLLGINARSPAERRTYAERLASLEHERMERILSFQRAYSAAFARLYPNEPRIATDSLANALTHGRRAAHRLGLADKRKAVFVRAHDCAACRASVMRLAAAHTPMDIFVIGADNDEAIRQWAKRIGLNPARVRSGEITLNHAPQAMAKALAGESLPRIIKR